MVELFLPAITILRSNSKSTEYLSQALRLWYGARPY